MNAAPFRPRVLLVCDDRELLRSLAAALAPCPVDVFEQPGPEDVLEFVMWGEPAMVCLALSGPGQMRDLAIELGRWSRDPSGPGFVLVGLPASGDERPDPDWPEVFDHIIGRRTAPAQVAALVRRAVVAGPRRSRSPGARP